MLRAAACVWPLGISGPSLWVVLQYSTYPGDCSTHELYRYAADAFFMNIDNNLGSMKSLLLFSAVGNVQRSSTLLCRSVPATRMTVRGLGKYFSFKQDAYILCIFCIKTNQNALAILWRTDLRFSRSDKSRIQLSVFVHMFL